jgi:hypothetical protein
MQVEKFVKLKVGGWLAQQLQLAGAQEGVAAAELLRRALYVYLKDNPITPIAPTAPAAGPSRALPGYVSDLFSDSAPGVPSFSPPSSPPAPPLSPPSLSPPAPLADPIREPASADPAKPADIAADPGEPAESGDPADSANPPDNGLLFPALPEPGATGSSASPPPLLLFPCLPRRAGGPPQEWPLSAGQVAQWEETFPAMDVLGEARKARQWLLANHLKTLAGLKTFLFRWLCKAQDSGRFMRHDPGRSGRSGGSSGSGGAGALRSAAPRTLLDVYGFASWEEWEALLREHFEGADLDQEMGNLGKIREKWEARHG